VCPNVNAPAGRLLGAYDLRIAIQRASSNVGLALDHDVILGHGYMQKVPLHQGLNGYMQRLKELSSIKRKNKDHDRKVIQDSLIEIDLRLDKGIGLPDDRTKRVNLFFDLKDIDHHDSIDLAQKAKIKWAVKGDENSKFFHGIVNKKRRHLAIKVFDLEDMVSNEEIKRAVWDCSSDNLVIGDIVSQEQSTFIKRRQIMDDPLILNEVISWCKARKEQLLMFKVDFQKAFNSVRWDHLDDILGKYGFGIKWRGWIRGCLQSSKALVLVNGSPMDEFSFHRGLRKEIAFLPSFFILVMESLHVSFQRLVNRVNVHKSSIYGVCVRQADVQHMAENFGCISNNLPFTYLGVKVGANMMWLNLWSDVVKKVSNKLSNWKAKTLSIEGRLTLLKSIWKFLASSSSLWIKVIKSIHGNSVALNNPYSSRLKNSTWIGILKAINKLKVKRVDLMGFCKIVIGNGNTTRFWHDIWYGDICFKEKFKRLFNLELQKDAIVASKLQASDVASSFRRPPRSGIKNSQFIELGQILSSISLSSVSDRWSWTLHGLGDFSVKSAREEIDKHVLVVSPSQNRWSKFLPIKLNVFSWRMMPDRLPTRSNLHNRGINITCILCPNCGAAIENRNHLFLVARCLWI
nr:RNA-directed DNA polymerase, eukaryota, reverse transcriptase zinc-binding domain protein [Tanacetum cinerariifolium]